MITDNRQTWQAANYNYLLAALKQLQADFLAASQLLAIEPSASVSAELVSHIHLEQLCQIFKLSPFERQVLLLCIGFELIPGFSRACAPILGKENLTQSPSFEMALALFATTSDCALNPHSPLHYWQLLEIDKRYPLLTQPLRINESILHYLLGYPAQDARLTALLTPLFNDPPQNLFYAKQVEYIVNIWQQEPSPMPLLYLAGDDIKSQRQIVRQVCAELKFPLYRIEAHNLPENNNEWQALLHLLTRDTWLHFNRLYLIECDNVPIEKQGAAVLLAQTLPSNCMLIGQTPLPQIQHPLITIPIPTPTPLEQQQLWAQALVGSQDHAPQLAAEISAQFNLNASQIQQFAQEFNTPIITDMTKSSLWQHCRQKLRQNVGSLVQMIEPQASWQDLNLPTAQIDLLHTIITQVKHRSTVYQQWGFSEKSRRGLGISALFAGPSGAGKTLAAEVIAHALQLDIYHIDLSAIVSKYIGETEKNLKQLFDNAEASGAILLFDEADSLFGKRNEVKDSHDRYANLQINFLLQQMEAYRGLSILTTNLKNTLDDAFLRRIRFIVKFPFPDYQQRCQIWQHIFPTQTPIENLNYEKLARLNLAGGHIRNIAVNAAFLAAAQQKSITMAHLLQATQGEYLKLERVLTHAEIQDWCETSV